MKTSANLTRKLSTQNRSSENFDPSFISSDQCDQIGRFIGLLASFQSLRQQLICPNLSNSQAATFIKVSKSIIFVVKSFLGNVYRHLATFYWSHWQKVKGSFLHRLESAAEGNEQRTDRTEAARLLLPEEKNDAEKRKYKR